MGLNPQQQRMAELIFTMGRQAGLPVNRSLELVAAAYAESRLNPSAVNKKSGAAGLFQLLSPGYVQRAAHAGGAMNPQANVSAILPDYVNYWKQHPGAAPGEAGRDVERSGQGAGFYANPLALLGGVAAGGAGGGGLTPSSGPSSPALTMGAGTDGPSVALAGGLNLATLHGNLARALADSSARIQNGGKADFATTVEPALFAFADAANSAPAAPVAPPSAPPASSEGSSGPTAPKLPKGSGKLDSRLITIAHQYGLKITSGYRSPQKNEAVQGAPDSYHLEGRAIDVSPTANAKAFVNWAFHHPQYFAEVFYDPAGMFVKDGKLYRGQIGGHSDHVHIAVR